MALLRLTGFCGYELSQRCWRCTWFSHSKNQHPGQRHARLTGQHRSAGLSRGMPPNACWWGLCIPATQVMKCHHQQMPCLQKRLVPILFVRRNHLPLQPRQGASSGLGVCFLSLNPWKLPITTHNRCSTNNSQLGNKGRHVKSTHWKL